jgi:hypothetical protein
LQHANEDVLASKELCSKVQQLVPFLGIDDPERLDSLQQKYIAIVAKSQDAE